MEFVESKEVFWKKLNIVIMGLGELWQWFYNMLKETNSNVFVVSVSWKNNEQYENAGIEPYNRYEWFPIKYDDIDVVLLCCRTDQLEAVKTLIPEEILPKVVDKIVSFQNGFGVREKLIELFGKSPAKCIPNLSFKCYDWKNITLNFAKSSPIKWIEQENIHNLMDILNDYTSKKFWKYLFEWVDSLALHREGEYKAFMNTVLNSLCVIYKWNVKYSLWKFKGEFGIDVLDKWAQEISNILNLRLNKVFETNAGEVKYYIEMIAKKFANEKPSTYQQYYQSSKKRWEVLSEDNHLLWYIVNQSKQTWIVAPISNEIWNRMKNIEKEINQSLSD